MLRPRDVEESGFRLLPFAVLLAVCVVLAGLYSIRADGAARQGRTPPSAAVDAPIDGGYGDGHRG